MTLTKGEYCQFSLRTRVQLLREFGQLEFERTFEHIAVRIFALHDFYVEVVYNRLKEEVERAEPVNFQNMMHLYEDP
jgi:hypothetical protein